MDVILLANSVTTNVEKYNDVIKNNAEAKAVLFYRGIDEKF